MPIPASRPLGWRLRQVSANSLWLLAARLLGQGIGILFVILLARSLGAAGLGQFAFLSTLLYLGNVFTTFGMDTLLIRETAISGGAPSPLPNAALWLQLGLTALYWLGLTLVQPWLPDQRAESELLLLAIFALSLLPLAFATLYSAILRGHQRMDLYALFSLLPALLQLLAGALILHQGGDLLAIGALLLAVNSIGALTAWTLCRRLPPVHLGWPTRLIPLRQIVRSSWPLALLALLALLYQRLGILSLTTLQDAAATGWYSAASRLVEGAKLAPYALFGALFPALARAGPQIAMMAGELPAPTVNPSTIGPLAWALVALAAAAAGLVAWVAPLLVPFLYGEGYEPAIACLRTQAWSLPPFVLSLACSVLLVTAGRERLALLAMMVTLLLTAGLTVTLVQIWGVAGACQAAVLAEVTQALILLLCCRLARLQP